LQDLPHGFVLSGTVSTHALFTMNRFRSGPG
jgi:hypothetical protein